MSDVDVASLKLICGEALQAEGRVAAVRKLRLLTGWSLRQSVDWIDYEFSYARDQQHREVGYADGRRQALEEAARAAGRAMIPEDCSPAEAHGRLMQAAASRDAVLALIKEPKA